MTCQPPASPPTPQSARVHVIPQCSPEVPFGPVRITLPIHPCQSLLDMLTPSLRSSPSSMLWLPGPLPQLFSQ